MKSMTREEAMAVRSAQLQGDKVTALELQQAVHVLSRRRNRRFVLPPLARPVRELANATLCFNLGRALSK
jgi:hypothetical protein